MKYGIKLSALKSDYLCCGSFFFLKVYCYFIQMNKK